MKTILITGSNGFIGKKLYFYLLNKKYNIFKYEEDILDIHNFTEKADIVVHLASKTGNPPFLENKYYSYKININGTISVLEYCKKFNAKLIFLSSSSVYGTSEPNELISEDKNKKPVGDYATSKSLAEDFCKLYNDMYSINCIILRLFNVYGEGQKLGFLIPDIINSINIKEQLILRNPHHIRDFVYIDDCLKVIEKSFLIDSSETINLGTGISTSVLDIVKLIEKIKNININYSVQESQFSEVVGAIANISHSCKILGWKPEIDIQTGIELLLKEELK